MAVLRFTRHRQPRDDIPVQLPDPTLPRQPDCAYIHTAVQTLWLSSLNAKKETRRSAAKRFIKRFQNVGRNHLLPVVNPLWDWVLWHMSPSYYLRKQHHLLPSDLANMSADELLELMRIGLNDKDRGLSRSVAKELERRAKSS